MIVLVLVAFLVCLAIFSRRKKNRLYMEKKLLEEQFDAQLMQNRIEVQEATFNSLGTELHDNIGQLLSTAKMLIGITERQIQQPPATLISANETLDKAITELRGLSKSLNKDWMEQFDLYQSLIADIERINAAAVLHIKLSRSGHLLPANADQQFIFYRLLQEAIQNVIKHAAATDLHLVISYEKTHITAVVEDNGKGFDTRKPSAGLGMKIMQQRAKILGGTVEWQSYLPGTRLTIVFPIKKAIV